MSTLRFKVIHWLNGQGGVVPIGSLGKRMDWIGYGGVKRRGGSFRRIFGIFGGGHLQDVAGG